MKFRSKSGKTGPVIDLIESGEPVYIDPLILATACSAQYTCFELIPSQSRENLQWVHATLEFVLGYPIWSHELSGSTFPWKLASHYIRKQYPRMPHYHMTSRKKGNLTGRKILRIYGNELLEVKSARLTRDFDPMKDLQEKFPNAISIEVVKQ